MTAETFLAEFHDARPGLTPRAFRALPATMDGSLYGSTYELLAAQLAGPGPKRILDMACGDGHFIEVVRRHLPDSEVHGTDLSAGELRLAAARLGPSGALCRAQAQALPYRSSSFDAVTSHLALMLMSEPERVIGEAGRVLRGGGLLRAIVSAPPPASPAIDVCREILAARGRDARWSGVKFGDARWRSAEGITDLLAPALDVLRIDDVMTSQRISPPELGQWLDLMYDLHFLEPKDRDRVRQEIVDRARARCDADGRIELAGAMRCVAAVKRQ